MFEHELLSQMNHIVEQYLEGTKYASSLWGFGNGRFKHVTEVTNEEIAAMKPRQRQSLYQAVHNHEMAKQGYLILTDGAYKRPDDLTVEDVPKLPFELGIKMRQYEVALKLLDFVSRGVQDLQEIGFEVHPEDNETIRLWIRKRRA